MRTVRFTFLPIDRPVAAHPTRDAHVTIKGSSNRFVFTFAYCPLFLLFFEDKGTGKLIGTTPAAFYHIEMLDLNHPTLIGFRRERTLWMAKVGSAVVSRTRYPEETECEAKITRELLEMLKLKIPVIPPPPPPKAA